MATGNPLFSLDGRIALVTEASRGLGLAMAEGLAEAGATVLLNGRNALTLDAVVSTLRGRGLNAEKLPFDVTDHHAARSAIDAIIARHGRLDTLIANAGILHRAPLDDWTLSDWDRILATNLKSCLILAQQAAKSMRQQGRGRIIFTTSIASILGRGGIHGYVASKSGLVGLTRSLACELGEHGITCNGICPGYFETELTSSLLQREEFVMRLNSRVPLPECWPVGESPPRPRMRSPSGASTLMISAPYWPRRQVQAGPTTTLVRSRTRSPASGSPVIGSCFHCCEVPGLVLRLE